MAWKDHQLADVIHANAFVLIASSGRVLPGPRVEHPSNLLSPPDQASVPRATGPQHRTRPISWHRTTARTHASGGWDPTRTKQLINGPLLHRRDRVPACSPRALMCCIVSQQLHAMAKRGWGGAGRMHALRHGELVPRQRRRPHQSETKAKTYGRRKNPTVSIEDSHQSLPPWLHILVPISGCRQEPPSLPALLVRPLTWQKRDVRRKKECESPFDRQKRGDSQ